ncbi:hypothetical protein Ahy_A07g032351 [Arachis hypogaea]|uniref:Plant methyltransferase dimerisation domain-containing protein n=1 Tax=Arachis hypogaea TaxID=3818 RepID=A0A445C6N0_ARAHY|nr:hypothetical protein Ahy_A07g032351 [Arachis hypogaea]
MSLASLDSDAKLEKQEDDAFMFAQMACSVVVPMAVRTTIELGVFDIIAKEGEGAKLSAKDIADRIGSNNPEAASMLDRVLRLLASHSLLSCSVVEDPESSNNLHHRLLYSLSPVSKYFVTDADGESWGPSLAHLLDKVLYPCWSNAMEAMKVTQQATLPTPIPMLTTPSEFSQLSVVDQPQNLKPKLIFSEKIPENKTLAEIVKKSTQDKKYYVIYNGPMKGVYDDWAKAAPFTHQPKTIHKGGFSTIEEAKESLKEYEVLHPEQVLKRAEKAPAQAQRTPVHVRTGMLKNIPTRAEINDKKRVCRSNCRETLNLVLNWTLDKRALLGYYPINKEQLTKLVIFPEASPSDTYQFFQ